MTTMRWATLFAVLAVALIATGGLPSAVGTAWADPGAKAALP